MIKNEDDGPDLRTVIAVIAIFSCYNKSHAEISMTLTEIYCQTAICFLPLRLRAERTFLPPFVLILDLNPCTFARCLFLG
jgi:hypothetical protein